LEVGNYTGQLVAGVVVAIPLRLVLAAEGNSLEPAAYMAEVPVVVALAPWVGNTIVGPSGVVAANHMAEVVLEVVEEDDYTPVLAAFCQMVVGNAGKAFAVVHE
jgi:hypothetical protein